MNSKHIFTALGSSAFLVALVAVPGSWARTQEPKPAQVAFQEQEPQNEDAQAAELQGALNNLRMAQLGAIESDDDVHVFVNSGGSWLGAGISEVNAGKVKELKLPAERGVVLGKIVPDSPAAKAGLKESDVITEINGQRVEGTEQFRRMIREIPSGRAAQFTVWRDGKSQSLAVTLGKSEAHHTNTFVGQAMPGNFAIQIPDMPEMGQLYTGGPWVAQRTRLGIDAENLDGDFGNYFGAPDGEGILVRGVFPDTPAAKAGLKAGDVITSVNGERIRSVGELRSKLAENNEEKSMKLGLIRNKAPLTLTVELPAPAKSKVVRDVERTNI